MPHKVLKSSTFSSVREPDLWQTTIDDLKALPTSDESEPPSPSSPIDADDDEYGPPPSKKPKVSLTEYTAQKMAKLCSIMLLHGLDIEAMKHFEVIMKNIDDESWPYESMYRYKGSTEKTFLTPANVFCTYHGLAEFERKKLAEKLKETPFSLIVRTYPEVENVTCVGLAVCVRYVDVELAKTVGNYELQPRNVEKMAPEVHDELLGLLSVDDRSAENIADEINQLLEIRGVPWEKCVAVASDDERLQEVLKTRHGNMVCVNFLCRSLEMCFLSALKGHEMGVRRLTWHAEIAELETFLSRIFTYTSSSLEFNQFRRKALISAPKVLQIESIPWLLHHVAVKELLEEWDKWKDFFDAQDFSKAHEIYPRFQPESLTETILSFVNWQLEKVIDMDEKLRSDNPMAFGILAQMREFFVSHVLKGFLKANSTFFLNNDGSEKKFEDLDLAWLYQRPDGESNIREVSRKFPDCLIPIEEVSLGERAEKAAKRLSEDQKLFVKEGARMFYVDMAFEIARRFDLREGSPHAVIELLNPLAKIHGRVQYELVDKLIGMFTPKVVKIPSGANSLYFEGDVVDSCIEFCNRKGELLRGFTTEEQKEDLFVVKFWKTVQEEPGKSRFPVLKDIAGAAMVFPHTSRRVDEIFLKVNRVTKIKLIPDVLLAIEDRLLASQFVKRVGCYTDFGIPTEVKTGLVNGDYQRRLSCLFDTEKVQYEQL